MRILVIDFIIGTEAKAYTQGRKFLCIFNFPLDLEQDASITGH